VTAMSVMCVIPARGGSKRLPKKNIRFIAGKRMLQWSIEACLKSKYVDRMNLWVSTEDAMIKSLACSLGVNVIDRPQQLAEDSVWTQDVLKHAVKNVCGDALPDVLVRVQANSPQITGAKIDECIDKLLENELYEVFTVNQDGLEDAAIHVMRGRCVYQDALSVYKGVVVTDYVDMHDRDDEDRVRNMLETEGLHQSFIQEGFHQIELQMKEFLRSRHKPQYNLWHWAMSVPIVDERWLKVVSTDRRFYDALLNREVKSVLDVGCGFCMYWPFLRALGVERIVGIDLFDMGLDPPQEYFKTAKALVNEFCAPELHADGFSSDVIQHDVNTDNAVPMISDSNERFDASISMATQCQKPWVRSINNDSLARLLDRHVKHDGTRVIIG